MNEDSRRTSGIKYRVRPPLTSAQLNVLFSAGSPEHGWPRWQSTPDTSDWAPVTAQSLTWICAYADGKLVGFVNVAWDGRDHAFLLDPRVHPDMRHQGIGGELVRRAAAAARLAGCTNLHVDYEDSLTPFYETCGFRPTSAGLLALD